MLKGVYVYIIVSVVCFSTGGSDPRVGRRVILNGSQGVRVPLGLE